MKVNRETRRLRAHFLNGIAIALIVAGAVGPFIAGQASPAVVAVALVLALVLHAMALAVVSNYEK